MLLSTFFLVYFFFHNDCRMHGWCTRPQIPVSSVLVLEGRSLLLAYLLLCALRPLLVYEFILHVVHLGVCVCFAPLGVFLCLLLLYVPSIGLFIYNQFGYTTLIYYLFLNALVNSIVLWHTPSFT